MTEVAGPFADVRMVELLVLLVIILPWRQTWRAIYNCALITVLAVFALWYATGWRMLNRNQLKTTA